MNSSQTVLPNKFSISLILRLFILATLQRLFRGRLAKLLV